MKPDQCKGNWNEERHQRFKRYLINPPREQVLLGCVSLLPDPSLVEAWVILT